MAITLLSILTLLSALGYIVTDYRNNQQDIESPFAKYEIFDSYQSATDLESLPDVCSDYESEICAKKWLVTLDTVKKRNSNRIANAKFQYATDINNENEKLLMRLQLQSLHLTKTMQIKFQKFKWNKFKSSLIKRLFKLMSFALHKSNETVSAMILKISDQISNIYNHGRPCHTYCLDAGEPSIVDMFETERDYDKLSGFWLAWNNETGRRIKQLFIDRMSLENFEAKENGFPNAVLRELEKDFEENNFNETVIRLYREILPLYKQLHGYVRHCLSGYYRGRFDPNGPIPAHILGNVWAQQWNNIMPILNNCQRHAADYNMLGDVDENLRHLSTTQMLGIAEKFFTSIGLPKMTSYFWERSILHSQPGKTMDCHASAHDFHNGVDFRIKMCAKSSFNDFSTIHHEMGHIQYFMAYKNLPYMFQTSANSGFHEAIGDTIALSVKTPGHLRRIGLLSRIPSSEEFDINYLLTTALEKVAFLPFALTMDSYLWSVYNGSVPYNELNKHWWHLRLQFQGLMPPVERTEKDFDPASKYHMAMGIPYIRYFTSFIYQFQFYEAMCKLMNYSGPLHRCNFYQSTAAGEQLLKMLKKGRSQHWRDSLEILTGDRDISSKSMMTFFKPLYQWLKKTNARLKVPIGW